MHSNVQFILQNQKDFLKFLKSRYKIFHLSNVFFRDIHYGLMAYLQMRGMKASYGDAETQSRELALELERSAILKNIDDRTWLLVYPEFKLVQPKPAAKVPAQPVAPKPAVSAAIPARPAS